WPFTGQGQSIPWDLSPDSPSAIPAPIPLPELIQQPRGASLHGGAQVIATLGLGLFALATAWIWGRAMGSRDRRRWIQAALAGLATGALAMASVFPGDVNPRLLFFPIF